MLCKHWKRNILVGWKERAFFVVVTKVATEIWVFWKGMVLVGIAAKVPREISEYFGTKGSCWSCCKNCERNIWVFREERGLLAMVANAVREMLKYVILEYLLKERVPVTVVAKGARHMWVFWKECLLVAVVAREISEYFVREGTFLQCLHAKVPREITWYFGREGCSLQLPITMVIRGISEYFGTKWSWCSCCKGSNEIAENFNNILTRVIFSV